jgi:hypothetical protein
VKLNVAYPGNLFHRLIGPKGATIKALQEESGCRVNLPQDRNILGASAVTVVGPSAGVVKAEASIGALLAKVASEEAAYADSQVCNTTQCDVIWCVFFVVELHSAAWCGVIPLCV